MHGQKNIKFVKYVFSVEMVGQRFFSEILQGDCYRHCFNFWLWTCTRL